MFLFAEIEATNCLGKIQATDYSCFLCRIRSPTTIVLASYFAVIVFAEGPHRSTARRSPSGLRRHA
jgi:hypothetical protein